MGSFWEIREKEYYTNREKYYEDNPNQIECMSLALGIGLVLFFLGFCPMNLKRLNKEGAEYSPLCRQSFYKYPLYGVIKEKEIDTKERVSQIHFQSIESNAMESIVCRCKEVHQLYDAVETGDTILKTNNTLWIKIMYFPEYKN